MTGVPRTLLLVLAAVGFIAPARAQAPVAPPGQPPPLVIDVSGAETRVLRLEAITVELDETVTAAELSRLRRLPYARAVVALAKNSLPRSLGRLLAGYRDLRPAVRMAVPVRATHLEILEQARGVGLILDARGGALPFRAVREIVKLGPRPVALWGAASVEPKFFAALEGTPMLTYRGVVASAADWQALGKISVPGGVTAHVEDPAVLDRLGPGPYPDTVLSLPSDDGYLTARGYEIAAAPGLKSVEIRAGAGIRPEALARLGTARQVRLYLTLRAQDFTEALVDQLAARVVE